MIHVPAMISSNFDTKVDRGFKILVFTKSKEMRSNDVHVKQMMLNAIHVTLSIFSTSTPPELSCLWSLFNLFPGSICLLNSQRTIKSILSFTVNCCSKIYFTTHWRNYSGPAPWGIGVARGGPKGPGSPPIEMLPMIKMWPKKILFRQF